VTALEPTAPESYAEYLTSDLGWQELLNPYVSFKPIPSTFASSASAGGCPGGTLRFKARLANTSDRLLSNLTLQLTTLPKGALLANADGGPTGVGALLTVPRAGAYARGLLAPGDFIDVSFALCLPTKTSIPFFVDVLGDAQ
jgi:hypothetical protein